MDPDRVKSYIKTACATLNFEVGEIWCSRQKNMVGGHTEDLRFIQLYMTQSYEKVRAKLIQPKMIPDEDEVSKHNFSPVICDHVRSGGHLVWANTETMAGVLGRSDLPLRTAVGMPICCVGYDLCILVLFSPKYLQATHDRREFLYGLSAAVADTVNGFLPASMSSPIRSVVYGPALADAPPSPPGPAPAGGKRPFPQGAKGAAPPAARPGSADPARSSPAPGSPDGAWGKNPTRTARLQHGIIVQMWSLQDIPTLRERLNDHGISFLDLNRQNNIVPNGKMRSNPLAVGPAPAAPSPAPPAPHEPPLDAPPAVPAPPASRCSRRLCRGATTPRRRPARPARTTWTT